MDNEQCHCHWWCGQEGGRITMISNLNVSTSWWINIPYKWSRVFYCAIYYLKFTVGTLVVRYTTRAHFIRHWKLVNVFSIYSFRFLRATFWCWHSQPAPKCIGTRYGVIPFFFRKQFEEIRYSVALFNWSSKDTTTLSSCLFSLY